MSEGEDCVIKVKTVLDSGSNGQDPRCLELILLQSRVLCLLKKGTTRGWEVRVF